MQLKIKLKKNSYCLQPIVLRNIQEDVLSDDHRKSSIQNATIYEVIDGQQRLTTILIILAYLQDKVPKEILLKVNIDFLCTRLFTKQDQI